MEKIANQCVNFHFTALNAYNFGCACMVFAILCLVNVFGPSVYHWKKIRRT